MASTKGKVIKCRAAVSWEANKPLVLEEIEVAPPKANEIRIKIIATGVCHTDLSGMRGILPLTRFPTVLGHEASGVVESVGDGVTHIKEGDHVLPIFLPECQTCDKCQNKDENICRKFMAPPEAIGFMSDGTTRMTCKGKTLHHFLGTSTFTEYTVVETSQVAKVNPKAPLDKISILSCGVSTGYGSPIKVAKVTPGSTCVVFGLGAVGLGAVMGCRIQGAKRIIGIDLNNEKKEISQTIGVTEFYNPKEFSKPIHEVLIEKTDGGVDFSFECIGNIGVLESALYCTKPGGGHSCIVGVPAQGKKLSFDPYTLLYGRHWSGCWYGGFKPLGDSPGLVEDYMNKKIMLDEFITATLPIEEVNKALDMMIEGDGLKTVLYFTPGFKV